MIELVIDQRRRSIGALEVGRVLPFVRRRMVGPFVFFDHMGPVDLPRGIPRSVDVLPHPHIGLSTVTWLFAGELTHRDSVGSEQGIVPGELNWMVAGRGITHSERLERLRAKGGSLHGIQAWVALPEADEETEPDFRHHPAEELPLLSDAGLQIRVLAGEAFGARSAARIHSPLFYLHCELAPGATAAVPADVSERAAYVANGTVEVEGSTFQTGQMLVFSKGSTPTLRARTAATVMMLGGEPLGPRFIDWNFVSSSRERVEQAVADWRAGRMKLPDFDQEEFVPYPGQTAPRPSGTP
ncbi:MAG TPA: pirin family protein [Myxococcota bacterium]|nr:pirin family protein [Myxococcota bacterium]